MVLIVGLGNPGKKFLKTRHNLGFWVLDEFRKKHHFPVFKPQKEFLSLTTEKKIGEKKIILVKPQTFMNLSGKAVFLLKRKFGFENENLWVVYDDLNLAIGRIKISHNIGSGGHRGIASIIQSLKTENFVHFRIGAGKEKIFSRKDLVLEKFSKTEEEEFKKAVKKMVKAIETALEEGLLRAMTEFNKK
jgi:PTH1 family peptidyl-tRNA hydrolase